MCKIKLKPFHKCLIIFYVFVLYSCGTKPDLARQNIDKSLLDEETCNPPCWHGLVIDKSTKEDVLSTLNKLPFVEHNAYREHTVTWVNMPAIEIQFICASDHTTVCGGAMITNNILRYLWTRLEYEFTLKDATNRLGEPEYIVSEWPSISGKCSLEAVWNIHGMAAAIYDDSRYNECESISDGNKISPSLIIESVSYFTPEDYGPIGGCCERIVWPGFKDE